MESSRLHQCFELVALKYFGKCCTFETWQGTHWSWQLTRNSRIPDFSEFSQTVAFHFIQTKPFLCRMISPSIQLFWPRKLVCRLFYNFCIFVFLYFCVCLFHRLLHFPCTEDLSIRQAPHYPQACNLPQCLHGGEGGWIGEGAFVHGTPIARPPRDKSTPWQTKPPIASWVPFD